VFSGDAFAPILSGIVGRVGEFEFGNLDEEGLDVESLKSRIQEGFPEFLGKAIVYSLAQSDLLMNPKSAAGTADFTDLIEEVKAKIGKSLPEYISAHVEIEIQNAIDEANARELELPEPIRMRSLPRQAQPISVVVNPPNITMPEINVSIPERTSNIDVAAPTINYQPPSFNIESPTVNVSVPEKQVNIQVDVPKQDAPIVNMSQPDIQVNVSPTPVNVNVNPTPIELTNEVNVEPTPLEINVNLPPKTKREITIVKDSDNTWHGESEEA
jgi:hypothetical protein